ncbi:MAG: hypothetical protein IT221_00085 [Fluviicola sp.]|nr:hypothetical protein [Fluviicola sp.]
MKKITYPLLIALAVLGTSCKKEKTTPTVGGTNLKDFYFLKDGLAYDPTSIMIQHTAGKIMMSTSTQPDETVALNIADSLMPGDYSFSSTGPFRLFYTPDYFTTSYVSESGMATIVSHDTINNKIQAYFSCMLVCTSPADTIYVTNGEINQTYPQ